MSSTDAGDAAVAPDAAIPPDAGTPDAATPDSGIPDAAVACPVAAPPLVCPGSLDQPACPPDGGAGVPVTACPAAASPVTIKAVLFVYEGGWGPHPVHCVSDSVMERCGLQRGWEVTVVRNPAEITAALLADKHVVIFAVTGPAALAAPGLEDARAALQAFIQRGGGFAGIHSITATDQGLFGSPRWDWFATMVGAAFWSHPGHPTGVQPGVVRRVGAASGVLAGIPAEWLRCEEWHTVRPNPVDNNALEILLTLDEACTPSVGLDSNLAMGQHPLSWRRTYDGGRVFITMLGHSQESYAEPLFLQHVTQGVEWAAGN